MPSSLGSCTAIEIAKCGMPCRKLLVPSSGSMMKRGLSGITFDLAALFHQEAPVGARDAQFVPQRALGVLVGLGNEVGRPLAADLKVLDLAKVAAQALARPCGRPFP
jgi:hypothetical protein